MLIVVEMYPEIVLVKFIILMMISQALLMNLTVLYNVGFNVSRLLFKILIYHAEIMDA